MSIFSRSGSPTTTEKDLASPFHSLSPIANAEIKEYEKGLLWALRNRKKEDIKNVALTGPYGSGKSSILKTFQERYKNEFHFLNISLATFKEELIDENESKDDSKDQQKDTDILRLIELSILQQIFYHEEDKTIPDSRFKKIRSFKKSNLVSIASAMFVLLLCGFNLFSPGLFDKEFHLSLSANLDLALHMTCLALMIAGIYIILLRSVRVINSIKISKLKFHDAEIEVDKGISKSILNNHLDELLYFFEVTPYTVVIIEDLDRFQQTEIFTKLRELNLLINNSEKIRREIVFIYAVRDDMFRDKDRTKFFDFIVPVIPVINSSNSNDMLREVIKKNKYTISEVLVDDISYFIDDMRLLYNIVNEYYFYHERLDKKLPQDKLLAMIVYKNIHPNDFVKLSEDKGELFKVIQGKSKYVKALQERLEKEIQGLKTQVSLLETNKLKDVKELRKLYVMQYLGKLDYFINFYYTGNTISIDQATSEIHFEKLRKDEMQYTHLVPNYSNNYNQYTNSVDHKFAKIENEVDSNQTYAERLVLVKDWGNAQIESLKAKIASLEIEKLSARHLKLTNLINDKNVTISLPHEKQNLLVNILLRNGYIEEDYAEFTSIFYEGTITKEDRQYLLHVKSQIALDFDFQLKKVGKLVEKINPVDFSKEYILNYSLADYLLAIDNVSESHKRAALIRLVASESETAISFIDGYIYHGKQVHKLIALLYLEWPGFWPYVSKRSTYTVERKAFYLQQIVAYASNESIIASAKQSLIDLDIAKRVDFLEFPVAAKKLKELINGLKIKFSKADLSQAPKELVAFVEQENHYEINTGMLEILLRYHEKYDENIFRHRNFEAIKSADLNNVLNYITNNVQNYVDHVFLKLPENLHDTENLIIELLNNETLSSDSKEAIIDRMVIKISQLKDVSDEFHTQLLENSKVKANWDNLIYWYKENEEQLFDTGTDFISEEKNLAELAKVKINVKVSEEELAQVKKFLETLLNTDGFTAQAYEQVLKAIPYAYTSLTFDDLQKDKVVLLISKDILNLTPKNFNYLKLKFAPLHIALLIQKHLEFVKRIAEFELDEQDILQLLQSDKLSTTEKVALYSSIPAEIIISRSALAKLIGQLLIQHPNWSIDNPQLIQVLRSQLSMADSVQLFNMRFKQFSKAEVTQVLQGWPSPYSEIAIYGKRPLLDHRTENSYFANNLKTLGYISKAEPEKRGIRISTFKK